MTAKRPQDRRLFIPPVDMTPKPEGSLTFCPTCHPAMGLCGPQRHNGDMARQFPGGDKITAYEGDTTLLRCERLLKPSKGPALIQEWAVGPDGTSYVRCPLCRFQYLRTLRFSDTLRVTFQPGFPDAALPIWAKDEDFV